MSASALLVRHAASPAAAVRSVHVEARRTAGQLRLSWRLAGDLSRLCLPEPREPERRDGLWQHSCFEAFLRVVGEDGYHEFNFAPSGDWAAYRFASRRAGRSEHATPAPRVRAHRASDRFLLDVEFGLGDLSGADLQAGIAAVVEESDGALSYWALAHGAAAPDFHDPATFTMRLPAP